MILFYKLYKNRTVHSTVTNEKRIARSPEAIILLIESQIGIQVLDCFSSRNSLAKYKLSCLEEILKPSKLGECEAKKTATTVFLAGNRVAFMMIVALSWAGLVVL